MIVFRHIKSLYQRAKRGYSDSDLFNLDEYILELFPRMLRDFSKQTRRYPGVFNSMEEWRDTLEQMAQHFERASASYQEDKENKLKQEYRTYKINLKDYLMRLGRIHWKRDESLQKGLELLSEHFHRLWF